MQKGTISIQTENILPIIKKYLYSDQEIFLRELVANAVDATQKLRTLSARGKSVGSLENTNIEISVNKEAKTITISDKGIGMTHDEVEKYITQIAFSSAKEFLTKYENANTVIGHFGLGFYSAFMVADTVEINTKSWQADMPATKWVSDGGLEYEIGESEKSERGTDITLHIGEEGVDYLEEHKISELLNKYCRFLPVQIQFGTTQQTIEAEESEDETAEKATIEVPNIINDTKPAWTKRPNDLTEEDYISFYRQLYPASEDPLFWIHLNVDYPFKLTGILYFPKLRNNLEIRKDKIQLYCNQVFVTDHVEQIVPEFLTLLHGVIDSADIPLNVSRSYLQSDPEVKKINRHITKKVAGKLDEMFRQDRKAFEDKWEHTGILIKYGMLSEDKFYDKAVKFCLYETVDNQFFTFDEMLESIKEKQTDKDGKTVALYTTDADEQHSYIAAAKDRGYEVLKLDATLDSHFINLLEQKMADKNISFKRVDAETLDKLIDKDEKIESVLSEEQETKVKEWFETASNSENTTILLQAMSPNDNAVVITRPEFIRRMKDMSVLGGQNYASGLPDMYSIIVNTNHSVITKTLELENEETQQKTIKQLHDLALLQQGMLKGEALTNFVKRSVNML